MKEVNNNKKKIAPKKVSKKKERVISDLEGNVKKIETKQKKKRSVKEHFKKYKKMYLRILLAIVLVTVIILGYIGIRNLIIMKKYGKYEEKMNNYGFSLMYNNESPKSYEKVTRVEMVKMIISSIYNDNDISDKGFISEGKFENDEWAEFAIAAHIIAEEYITEENYDEIATFEETLITYLAAREELMKLPVSSKTESSFKNLNSFNDEQRKYINDAVENGLLDDEKGKLKLDKQLIKGELNKLVVKFVEKYNTILPEGETMVTKKESMPSNADMYPYIVYSIDKEVYEYKGISEGEGDYATPLETYKYKKNYYEQAEYKSEKYYNAILNVDYRTINKEKFYNSIIEFLRYEYKEDINKYVDYVVENKIVIEGEAKILLPIFYLDGISYRGRMKLTFEIKNTNTDKNILLGDLSRYADVTYKDKKYEVYVDVPMGTTLLSRALLLDIEPVIDMIVSDKNVGQGRANEF